MNTQEAKRLSLPDIMARLGFEPASIKKGGNEYWYRSPFRQEDQSSFHTSFLGGKWIWNDFADSSGTVIDFILRYKGFRRVGDALAFLDALYQPNLFNPSVRSSKVTPKPHFSFQQQKSIGLQTESRELEFIKAHQIQNPAIYRYLEKRGISPCLTDRYLREVKYRNIKTNRIFFAFGMKNESGGYEIRAATDQYKFKSALIKRDITLVKGLHEGSYKVNLFEGMTDFLSLLVMLNVSNLSGDSIIMHSLSSFQRTILAIQSMKYQVVSTFLDNNVAGQKNSENFKSKLDLKVNNQSDLFEPFEDLNDALVNNLNDSNFFGF